MEQVKSSSLLSGIDEQGLYRIVGVSSKVQKLLNLAMGKHKNTSKKSTYTNAHTHSANIF